MGSRKSLASGTMLQTDASTAITAPDWASKFKQQQQQQQQEKETA